MLETHQIDELICLISSLDRDALVRQFASYRSSFPVDFTPEFLNRLSLERLQHLFLALCIQSKRLPEVPADAA